MKYKNTNSSVAIILGFYNGKKYLKEQLNSILFQTHKNIKIFIFDDHSPNSLEKSDLKVNKKFEKIKIIRRENNIGFAKNFLYGLNEIEEEFEFFAFSDQDDIWDNDKLEKALSCLSDKDPKKPILYCCRTAYYNADCSVELGSSKIFKKPPIFQNALVQNIAAGNTLVMNKAAKNIISKTLNSKNFVSHDWWCYQIISAVGGEIIYRENKTLKYRQHKDNIIGKNNSFSEKIERLNSLFNGTFKNWCDINIENLYKNRIYITKNNFKILCDFEKARKARNPFAKLKYYLNSGVFRQSKLENIFIMIGLFINKI